MYRMFTSAIIGLSAMLTSPAVQAKPPSGGQHSNYNSSHGQQYRLAHAGQSQYKQTGLKYNQSYSYKNYHTQYGKKFSHGFYYQGRNHNHWSYQCYWARYGCSCYWCPSSYSWYYWCEPRSCYMPVTYIEYAAPTVAPQVVITNTATASTGGPAVSAPTTGGVPGDLPPPPSGAGPVQPYKAPQ